MYRCVLILDFSNFWKEKGVGFLTLSSMGDFTSELYMGWGGGAVRNLPALSCSTNTCNVAFVMLSMQITCTQKLVYKLNYDHDRWIVIINNWAIAFLLPLFNTANKYLNQNMRPLFVSVVCWYVKQNGRFFINQLRGFSKPDAVFELSVSQLSLLLVYLIVSQQISHEV